MVRYRGALVAGVPPHRPPGIAGGKLQVPWPGSNLDHRTSYEFGDQATLTHWAGAHFIILQLGYVLAMAGGAEACLPRSRSAGYELQDERCRGPC